MGMGNPRIIGGEAADRNEYPYAQVSFQTMYGHSCGGSVVASDMILTAAHCLPDPDDIIVVGVYGFFNDASLETAQVFRMEQYAIHPSYNDATLHYDVLLIKVTGTITVTGPVQINQEASIASLLSSPSSSSSSSNERLTTVGFGATTTEFVDGVETGASYPDVLQELDLTLVDNISCEQIFTDYGVDYSVPLEYDWVTDDMMCAANQGTTSCFGDSGSPLLILDKNDPSLMPLQVGLTSWSLSCSGNFPVVFHRTSHSFDWIRENICRLSTSPPDYLACNTADSTFTVSPTIAPTPVPPPTAAPSIMVSTELPTNILTASPTGTTSTSYPTKVIIDGRLATEAPVDSLTNNTSTFKGQDSSMDESTISSSSSSSTRSPLGLSWLIVVFGSLLCTSCWMFAAFL
jgi:trypsin